MKTPLPWRTRMPTPKTAQVSRKKKEDVSDVFSLQKKKKRRDFPGSTVVKNPPSNAGEASSIPGWETQIPLAREQLSPYAATTEPAYHN